jgi:hypothetical protein
MEKKLIILICAFCSIFMLKTEAQNFNYEFDSKYRKVSTTGHEARDGLPGLGVGNIVFSDTDLPVGDDSNYTVKESFDVYNLSDWQARAFFPACMEKIFERIYQKYPSFRFTQWIARAALVDPSGYRIADQNLVFDYDSNNHDWEGQRYMMHAPQNNWRGGNMVEPYTWKSKDFEEGTYHFVITTKLIFEKTDELIGRWENDVWVERPAIYEVVLARGQCELVFLEENYVEPGEDHVKSREQSIREFYLQQEEEDNKKMGKDNKSNEDGKKKNNRLQKIRDAL